MIVNDTLNAEKNFYIIWIICHERRSNVWNGVDFQRLEMRDLLVRGQLCLRPSLMSNKHPFLEKQLDINIDIEQSTLQLLIWRIY